MEKTLVILSYILFPASVLFFVLALRQRKAISDFHAKDEAIKLRENEFKELRMMAAGVTHEINNALTVILGRTGLMLRRAEDPAQEKALTQIQGTCERIAGSIVGLRKVIYPDKAEVEEFIELPQLMESVFQFTGQRLRNHGVNLKLKGLEHKVVKGRKNQLEQLIINLLNQAVERLVGLQDKWIQMVAVIEDGRLNIYFMDASGEVGDKITHKQYSEILESNHGHLTVNQNNLILELPQPAQERYHV